MAKQILGDQQRLGHGPADMPDRGGKRGGTVQVTADQIKLNRREHPVANLEVRAGKGTVQCDSTQVGLSRTATSSYGPINATVPQTGKGGRKK